VPDDIGVPVLGVEDVARLLDTYNIAVRTMTADTSTAESAAQALHTDVASIVKSLLFMHGSAPVLALVSGTRSVIPARLAAVVGADSVRLARPQEVRSQTGYTVGGVPPVAHRHSLRVVMDRHLTEVPLLYAAAGSSSAIFEIRPEELSRIANAEVHDFAE
jgi:Cys-tRNA(Pro) deacylase